MTKDVPREKFNVMRFVGLVQIPLVVIASGILLYLGLHIAPLLEKEKKLRAEVAGLQTQLVQKQAALRSLNDQQNALLNGIATLNQLIATKGDHQIQAAAEQIPWWQQLVPKTSATPTGRKSANGDLYTMSVWLDASGSADTYGKRPPNTLARIQHVEYFFDDPSFNPKTKSSTNPETGFKITYAGWGCLNAVRVTIFPKGDSSQPATTTFDMCASLSESAASSPNIALH